MKLFFYIKQRIHYFFLFHKWKDKFHNSINLINKLEKFRAELKELDINLIDCDSILNSQKEWIWLHVILIRFDRKFLKPHWVWLDVDEYSHFIDISKKDFPVFNYKFYPIKPYRWELLPLYQSIDELIEKVQDKQYIEDYKKEKNKSFEEILDELDL